jgi:hypothetical protein
VSADRYTSSRRFRTFQRARNAKRVWNISSINDFLTMLYNGRRFEQALVQEIKFAARYGDGGGAMLRRAAAITPKRYPALTGTRWVTRELATRLHSILVTDIANARRPPEMRVVSAWETIGGYSHFHGPSGCTVLNIAVRRIRVQW